MALKNAVARVRGSALVGRGVEIVGEGGGAPVVRRVSRPVGEGWARGAGVAARDQCDQPGAVDCGQADGVRRGWCGFRRVAAGGGMRAATR